MPKIRILPEPPSKVFALATAAHLLAKLQWEVKGFRRASKRHADLGAHLIAAYHAFNCAVTAWHMADWIWMSTEENGRAEITAALDMPRADLGCFQDAIRRNKALNCCRDIATGSKHKDVSRRPDPDVRAALEWDVEHATVESSVDEPLARYRARLVIHDSAGVRPATDVFEEALDYWTQFLERWGFIEARFVTGRPVRKRL